jgi:hypothetical protein
MRLGQLARKLAVRPADIVEFLGQNQIEIHDGINTRLDVAHIGLIMGQFAPVPPDEPVGHRELETRSDDHTDQSVPDEPDSPGATNQEEGDEPATGEADKLEVIKAPKVELTGLKVLGKIELPEPKKTHAAGTLEGEDAVDESETRTLTPENKNDRPKKKKYPQRPKKNPIAARRERETRERQRKEEEQAAVEKERRTRYYHNRVKLSPPTKPVRLFEEPLEQMSAEELREPPKTWLGKMILWLTNA